MLTYPRFRMDGLLTVATRYGIHCLAVWLTS